MMSQGRAASIRILCACPQAMTPRMVHRSEFHGHVGNFHGLSCNGSLLVVGADMAPIEIPGAALISGRKRVQGWASGTPSDSEDTLRFAALTGVRPMMEKFPLEKAAEAYARMLSGHAQFRVVLTM